MSIARDDHSHVMGVISVAGTVDPSGAVHCPTVFCWVRVVQSMSCFIDYPLSLVFLLFTIVLSVLLQFTAF